MKIEMPCLKSPAWVSQLNKIEANLRYLKANYAHLWPQITLQDLVTGANDNMDS